MGLGFGADTAVRSTPVHAILGNFLHLDDGDFVASGAYRLRPARPCAETAAAAERTPQDAARTGACS